MDLDPRLRPSSSDNQSSRLPSIGAIAGARGSPTTANPPLPSSSSSLAGNHGQVGGRTSVAPPVSKANNTSPNPDGPTSPRSASHPQSSQQLNDTQATATASGENDAHVDGSDPKRLRACEACRGLKVRCEPNPDDEQAPCRRCRKAGRRCVITAPSRKRQKKTDSRVSELEKKIDALTASLQARGATSLPAPASGVGAGVGAGPHLTDASPSSGDNDPVRSPTGMPSRQRPSLDEPSARVGSQGSMGSIGILERNKSSTPTRRDQPPAFQPPMVMAGMKRKPSDRRSTTGEEHKASPKPTSSPWSRPDQGDIVDRGLITMETAAELFSRYTTRMVPHVPAVVFPPTMTAAELRRSKPILFLAIMSAACSEMRSLHAQLQRELMVIFAEKVFLSGDKSIDIVQSLLVAVIWYWPPEHFEELKFYQLVHIAAVMAIDIGLGKKQQPRRSGPASGPNQLNWQTHPFQRQGPLDPMTLESRRTWLACFFLASNTSISLHRPNLIRWTDFMTESLDVLRLSPDAAPTDEYFCHLVQQHRLGEEIGGQFNLDDPANSVDINDSRTQYALKALERDLEKLRVSSPDPMRPTTLQIGHNFISLYMHEIALHTKSAADQLRPPFNAEIFKDGVVRTSEALSSAHIGAISACLSAVDGMFTTFLAMDVDETRTLPVYNFVRVAYGVVILVKMYFSASSPGSELGKVIDKDNLRVEHYLDALLEKFRQTAQDDRSRPAAKFLVVLAMLKSWFIKQEGSEGKGQTAETHGDRNAGLNCSQLGGGQHGPQQTASVSTPLHLLSEVAAGSDVSGVGHRSMFTSMRQPNQPFFQTTTTPSSTASSEMQQRHHHHQQQTQDQLPSFQDPAPSWGPAAQQAASGSLPMDMGITGAALGLDFSNMGFNMDGQGDGTRMVLSEPWFGDVFQGMQNLPDATNMFPF